MQQKSQYPEDPNGYFRCISTNTATPQWDSNFSRMKILVGKAWRKKQLGRPMHRKEYNINADLKET